MASTSENVLSDTLIFKLLSPHVNCYAHLSMIYHIVPPEFNSLANYIPIEFYGMLFLNSIVLASAVFIPQGIDKRMPPHYSEQCSERK